MLDLLLQLDEKIFFFINLYLSNPFFDIIMPIFDNPKYWLSPLIIVWIYISVKDNHNRKKLLILIPLVIILSDQIGAQIKNLELRDRPWFYYGEEKVNHLGGNGGKHKSFPSNHSANLFGLSIIFSYIYYSKKKYFLTIAGIIGFSRIYIGVHYPFDVIVGGIIGTSVALILIYFWKKTYTN